MADELQAGLEAQLIELAEAVLPEFEQPFPAAAPLDRGTVLIDKVMKFTDLSEQLTATSAELRRSLRRTIQQLLELDRRVRRRASRREEGAPPVIRGDQITAASILFTGCIMLAPEDCAPGVQLLLGSGTLVLQDLAGMLEQGHAFTENALTSLVYTPRFQVAAMHTLLGLTRLAGGEALARVVAGCAPPVQLVAWMDQVVQSAALLEQAMGRPTGYLHARVVVPLAECLWFMHRSGPAFGAHFEELQQLQLQQPQQQEQQSMRRKLLLLLLPALASTAVALQLPEERRPAGSSWVQAASLAFVVAHPALRIARDMLAAEVQLGFATGTSIVRLLRAAALLMQHVPLDELAAEDPQRLPQRDDFWVACAMARLLAAAAYLQHFVTDSTPGDVQQQRKQAALLLPLIPPLSRLLGATAAAVQAGALSRRQLSTMCSYVRGPLRLLCDIALPESDSRGLIFAGRALEPPDAQAAWCSAAADCLRLLPLVAEAVRLQRHGAQVAADELDGDPALLAKYLCRLAHYVGSTCVGTMLRPEPEQEAALAAMAADGGQEAGGSLAALHSAVGQLHAAGCRMAHWCAAGRAVLLPDMLGPLQRWHLAIFPAMTALQLQLRACGVVPHQADVSLGNYDIMAPLPDPTTQPPRVPPSRWLQALCATTWQAFQCGAADWPPTDRDQYHLLALLAEWAPAAVATSTELQGRLAKAVQTEMGVGRPFEGQDDMEAIFYAGSELLQVAERSPVATALLLGGDDVTADVVTASMVGLALDASVLKAVDRIVGHILRAAGGMVAAAQAEAAAAASCPGTAVGTSGELLTALGEGMAALEAVLYPSGGRTVALAALVQQAMAAADGALRQQAEAEEALRQHLLDNELLAARRLAAALLRWWRRPQQEEADRLELAQAAATRSCAYLACANLGAEGGAGAGEGVGSKRCSGCRAVWYCGTACSHADWRAGGHRRVCKALAAARQAARQQRQERAGPP